MHRLIVIQSARCPGQRQKNAFLIILFDCRTIPANFPGTEHAVGAYLPESIIGVEAARISAAQKRWATVTAPAALRIQTSHPVRLTERAAAMPDHSQTASARLASGRGSDCHSEIANSLKQRKDLRTIGWRSRARQPELRKGAGGAAGIFRLKGRRRLGRFAPPAAR